MTVYGSMYVYATILYALNLVDSNVRTVKTPTQSFACTHLPHTNSRFFLSCLLARDSLECQYNWLQLTEAGKRFNFLTKSSHNNYINARPQKERNQKKKRKRTRLCCFNKFNFNHLTSESDTIKSKYWIQ